MRSELRIDALAALPEDVRADLPLDVNPRQARPPRAPLDAKLGTPSASWSGSSDAYTAAYRDRKLSPRDAVERALAAARALGAQSPSVGPILAYADKTALAEADESVARYRAGKPRGPLDGVPIAVKEMFHVRGLPCQCGTTYMDAAPRSNDATCTTRPASRACGRRARSSSARRR
jgi:hypothetical protein